MKDHHGSPICDHHDPVDLPYLSWHEWAEKKYKAGERQTRCPICKRVFYPEEMGTQENEEGNE